LPLADTYSRARTHTHTHTRDSRISPTGQLPSWYTLGNANAGGAVTFKPYNSKSI